jgi:glycosyltransferase involved in cell wall biosynthesis
MSEPLVSVLMPVYNASRHLRAALGSITAQTYRNLEIIAFDDGSKDRSLAILDELAASDNRIRVFSRENKGIVETLNEGLALAQGSLIARMDADDIAYPERIAAQVAEFERNPELCACGHDLDYLVNDRRILRKAGREVSGPEIRVEYIFHLVFVHPTIMLNNRILQRDNLRYSAAYPNAEDFDFLRRITHDYPVAFLNQKGLAWRQHPDSLRVVNQHQSIESYFRILDEQLRRFSIVDPGEIFRRLGKANRIGNDDDYRELSELLPRIRGFKGFSGIEHEAYERGFASLVSHMVQTLGPRDGFPRVVGAVDGAGLVRYVQGRYRMAARVSRLAGNRTAAWALRRAQRSAQLVRSQPLTERVELPASVVQHL